MFNLLSQYALGHVDTDSKGKGYFMRGLTTKLQSRIALNATRSFTDLVNSAIMMGGAIRAHQNDKKKSKTPVGS